MSRQSPNAIPPSTASSDPNLSWTRRACAWFLHSGIQEPTGGVARYYRSDTGRYHRISMEITGYGAAAFVYLYKLTGGSDYLEAALRAGRFLTETAWNPSLGAYPFEHPDGTLSYFFDCGIIARGLLSLHRLTSERSFLDGALAAGRAMARDFHAGGWYHPVVSLPAKEPLPGDGRWSRGPGCYQLKAAMAWYELNEAAGDGEFVSCYEAVLDDSLRTHGEFLAGEADRERLMDRLHAYCYFLEGLLVYASHPSCTVALREGISVAGRHLRELRPFFERSDVHAQLLRLLLFAAHHGIVPLDVAAAREEAAAIASFQLEGDDPRIDGGFCFGRKDGTFLPYVNPVSTIFCVQALEMWDQHQRGAFRADRLELI